MPYIKFLDPEDTGTVNWYGKALAPNKAVKVDAQADAELISAASRSPKFFEVSGLDGDAKEEAKKADAEAKALAEREAAALRAAEEAAQAAADAERAASEAVTQPGAAEQAAQQSTKKPGAR